MSRALNPQVDFQTPASKLTFSSEQALSTLEQQEFWSKVTQSAIKTHDNISLAYAFIEHPQSHKAIVISNGRVESYLKYQELIFDLYHQGYSIYALDHRGQGLSSRITANPHQGHIDKFSTYVDDFIYFMDQIVIPKQHSALFIVAHSMGSTIATLYLETHPQVFKAAIFSAPMYGIKLPVNQNAIRWLAQKLDTTSDIKAPNYVLGGKDYTPDKFANNDLTHSQLRYNHYRRLYQQQPKLQLGSPTNHWLIEAIDVLEKTIQAAKNSAIPILILQANEDTIIDNAAQDRAVGNLCQLIKIPNARHEIFMEQDNSRNMALTALVDFLQTHSV